MKVKVIRFTKNTINRMYWELQVIEHDNKYIIWKAHWCKDGGEATEEVMEIVTKYVAEDFIIKNKKYLVETYHHEYDEQTKILFETLNKHQ